VEIFLGRKPGRVTHWGSTLCAPSSLSQPPGMLFGMLVFSCALLLPLWIQAADLVTRRLAPVRNDWTRAESFLGIHFDFHAGPDCNEIGGNTTPAMVERIIDLVRPDYHKSTAKGMGSDKLPHQMGNQAPGFVGDPFGAGASRQPGAAWPYMHYSASGVRNRSSAILTGAR